MCVKFHTPIQCVMPHSCLKAIGHTDELGSGVRFQQLMFRAYTKCMVDGAVIREKG
jgi:hypothetical protein